MKKWYKLCPFCANEVKEWAIKCQYCHEFINTKTENGNNESDIEEVKNWIKTSSNWNELWYKNFRIWFIILFIIPVIAYNIYVKVKQKNANNVIDSYYNSIIDNGWVDDSFDTKSYTKALKDKYDNTNANEYFDELDRIVSKYSNSIDWISVLSVEELSDLKNESLLKEIINNWKKYKESSDIYGNDVSSLFEKVNKGIWNNGILNEVLGIIMSLVDSIDRRSEVNIELFSFALDIQNEFYIDENDEIQYYERTNIDDINKFIDMREKRQTEQEIFEEAYNKYTNYMVDFVKKQQEKNKK